MLESISTLGVLTVNSTKTLRKKASDIDIRRGQKEYPLLVLAMELYTF